MMQYSLEALALCREEIDRLDIRLLELLNLRTTIVEDIGRIKRGLHLPVYEPQREDQVFQNVLSHNHGPLSSDAAKRIFERIIDEMRAVQHLKILANE